MVKPKSKKIILNQDISNVYNKLSRRKIWTILALVAVTLVLFFLNLCVGASNQTPIELIANFINNPESNGALILFNLRLPHVLTSLLVGSILGICGCILQSSLGNPLAAPSTIGVSQGAACGACIAIICGGSAIFGAFGIVILAFVFALIPTVLIFIISKYKNFSATSIILSGIAMSIFFGGLVALVEYFADSSQVAQVVFWTFGSLYNVDYPKIIIMFAMLIFIIIYASINSLNFNAMECGDMTAHSVGINVGGSRLRHLVVAALSSACVTAFCGTINFIGLIAPHIMRRFVGANYKYLIPTSALCGACILCLSDILSAIILPGAILPIGAITSFIGAPIFIWILMKKVK